MGKRYSKHFGWGDNKWEEPLPAGNGGRYAGGETRACLIDELETPKLGKYRKMFVSNLQNKPKPYHLKSRRYSWLIMFVLKRVL